MITRAMNSHQYTPAPYPQQNFHGSIRTEYINTVPNSWAVTRPTSYPVSPHQEMNGGLARGGHGMFQLQLSAPNVEMDPSNPATWQRQYLFT